MPKAKIVAQKPVSPTTMKIPEKPHLNSYEAARQSRIVTLSRVKNEKIDANSPPSVESGFIRGQNCFDQCKSLLANGLEDDHSQSKSIKVTYICSLKSRYYGSQDGKGVWPRSCYRGLPRVLAPLLFNCPSHSVKSESKRYSLRSCGGPARHRQVLGFRRVCGRPPPGCC